MKAEKLEPKVKLPKNFTLDSTLKNQYKDEPLFKQKVNKAKHILNTVGLPK